MQVYDVDAFMSLTNTELLVQSFKETVDLRIESGEIEGIDVGNNRFFDVLLGMDIISQGSFNLGRSGDFP